MVSLSRVGRAEQSTARFRINFALPGPLTARNDLQFTAGKSMLRSPLFASSVTGTPMGKVAFLGTWPKGRPETIGTLRGSSLSLKTSSNVWRYSLVLRAFGSPHPLLTPMAIPSHSPQHPGVQELRQHAVNTVRRFIQILEEEHAVFK